MIRAFVCGLGVAVIVSIAPVGAQVRHRFDVRVPMRDGVELGADVYLPEGPGPHPTVLVRTPYMKVDPSEVRTGRASAARGYAFVVQDARGRGESDGEFSFLSADGKDGYDTIEWIARQPWSNGRIGIEGSSYRAAMAWLAARERPPHLTCMISQVPIGDHFDHGPAYVGGAFNTGWALSWLFGVSGRVHKVPVLERWPGFFDVLEARPLLTLDSILGKSLPIYREWLRHNTFDDYWKRITLTPEDFRGIDIPILALTGWFDLTQSGTMAHWRGIQTHSPAKDRQHILIGPWPHNVNLGRQTTFGGFKFSEESNLDMDSVRLGYWDHCLKGTSKAFDFPRARVYVMGSNVWRDLDAYPPRAAEPRSLHLTSGGRANSLTGDGRLSWTVSSTAPPDRYTYDPKRPVPSRGFDNGTDQTANQRREDVLVYTSDVLSESVEIIGPVEVVLHAATDARDTDFIVKLTDVYPDGRALSLGPKTAGVIRARYRKGFDREVLVTPGAVEEYPIRVGDVGHAFLAGHRIRLEITSSAAPWVNPNPNTGNPVATDTEWKVAQQTIYHDRARPSRVVLPVFRAKTSPNQH